MRRRVGNAALFLAGVLTGVLTVTRLNMSPVLFALALYAVWQHGRRGVLFFVLPALGVVLVVHVAYWPYILRLWLKWWPFPLPDTPFFRDLAVKPGGEPVWRYQSDAEARLSLSAEMFRLYALPLLGWVLGLQAMLRRRPGPAILPWLTGLTTVLLALHAWVTLFGAQGEALLFYIAFFAPLMLGLLPLALQTGMPGSGTWLGYGMALTGAVAVAEFATLVEWRVRWAYRLRKGLGEGYAPFQATLRTLARPLEALGLSREAAWLVLLGVGLVTLLLVAFWFLRKRGLSQRFAPGWLVGLLSLTAVAATPGLSGAYRVYDCPNGLAAVETVGRALNRVLREGDRLYWSGGQPAILLYVEKPIHLFPAQLNGAFNRRRGGPTETLHRLGYWNEVLEARWFEQANVVLLVEKALRQDETWRDRMKGWRQVAVLPAVNPCQPETALVVFRRP